MKMQGNKIGLRVKNLTVAYRDSPVLWDINFSIPSGILLAIIGPNGAGKSTLIKAVLNIVKKMHGEVEIFGESYKKQRKNVAYVPQKGSVDWDFPTTVLDVVLMGTYGNLGWIKRPGSKEKKASMEALEKVGMLDFKNRQISELSGGQQQRVFLARALVQNADMYFLDEPFQGVDATTEKAIIKILKELRNQGKTIIVVHHDLQTVKEYFDWVVLLNREVKGYGTVEKVFTDENLKNTYQGNTEFIN
ncbi:MAG TPA: metal ABC transporter ATP-binding protein [Chitinophagaceae bacterium]|nr:metal ABC transporter ATP-binding protein [Chitinophagaceae bacterium]